VIAATAVALGVLELGVAFNASSTVVLDPILAGVVAVGLLLRGASARRGTRVSDADATSWRSADEVRPIPAALARLTPVRVVRNGGIALLVAVGIALPYLLPVDKSLKSSAVLIYALLGLSMVVLTGWAGQVSLGQVGLFAIGAAVGAKATTDWNLDLLLALPIAGVVGAVAAVVVGAPALRLRGLELAVVTLAAAIAITSWLLNPRFFDWVPSARIERPPLLGRFDITSATAIHHLSLALLLGGLACLRGIRNSRTGRALLAARDNERGAQAYGLSPLRLRLSAFALSGALAGVAGAMFAHHQQAFGSQPFNPGQNFAVFTMVVLGGVGSPMGAVLGAVWLQGIRWFLPGEWQLLASGAGVLFILLVVPSGLGGLVLRLRDAWLTRLAAARGMDVPGFTMVPATSVHADVGTPVVTVHDRGEPEAVHR
jgi:branched-chain amino acid transport system permease protein